MVRPLQDTAARSSNSGHRRRPVNKARHRRTCRRQSRSRHAIGRRRAGTGPLIGQHTGSIKSLPGNAARAAADAAETESDNALTAGVLTSQIALSEWRKVQHQVSRS